MTTLGTDPRLAPCDGEKTVPLSDWMAAGIHGGPTIGRTDNASLVSLAVLLNRTNSS